MDPTRPTRSPALMNRGDSVLLVVDLQERLLRAQPNGPNLAWNTRRLLDAAAALGVRIDATEQAPDKLGPTVPELRERTPEPIAKLDFSAAACDSLIEAWRAASVRSVVVTGIETHVCVAQTALDLIAEGFDVFVPVDAVGSRFAVDHDTALRRLNASGVTLTTTEAAMFEWCETAADPAMRRISALAKEPAP